MMNRWHIGSVALLCAACCMGCLKSNPLDKPYVDNFERSSLGPDYHNTGGPYQITKGSLHIKGAYNKPLWLKKQLPQNAIVEFDVTSKTPDGDIKVEIWGDGESFATTRGRYLASSYVFIFGGWGNAISAIARLDEHGGDRKERRDVKVKPGQTYHFKIKRQGSTIDWSVDGKPFLSFSDPSPLSGPQHAYLGFNNWESDVYYDNLRITPLR